jgi:hypothetical protein
MKVYSQPEALEDHIAPAAISIPAMETPTLAMNGSFEGIGNNPNIAAIPFLEITSGLGPSPALPAEPVVLSDFLSEFNIRTIRVGAGDSLIDDPLDFEQAVFRTLLGSTTVESTLTNATISLLVDELSISNDVIEAIAPAVGPDRSSELLGLSSEEFSRTSGSAFLTSL